MSTGGESLLCVAVETGNEAEVERLLQRGYPIEEGGVPGRTPAFLAAADGNLACLRLLIKYGANVDAGDQWWGRTPLMAAARTRQNSCMRLLIEHGADVNIADFSGKTALIFATDFGDGECVRTLIECGADVNVADDDSRTPLIHAAAKGCDACVRVLLQHGADVNVKGDAGWTALIKAAEKGLGSCARLLIEHGADVNATTDYGWTALMYAVWNGLDSAVNFLLEHSARVDMTDRFGVTALHLAAQKARSRCVRSLLKYGADGNAEAKDGMTALHKLALKEWCFSRAWESLVVAQLLISHGVAVDRRDGHGNTALDLLLTLKQSFQMSDGPNQCLVDLFELLVRGGSDVNRHVNDIEKPTAFMKLLNVLEYEKEVHLGRVEYDIEGLLVINIGRVNKAHIVRLLFEYSANGGDGFDSLSLLEEDNGN